MDWTPVNIKSLQVGDVVVRERFHALLTVGQEYTVSAICAGCLIKLDGFGVTTFDPAYFSKGAKPPHIESKPSNPKDAFGSSKVSFSVIPPIVLAEIATGMLDGATKYGKFNWRGVGVRSSIYYDATLRHLMLWWEGQDIDPDSGLHHVTKAITSLTVLRDAMLQGKLEDDRPPRCAELESVFADLNNRTKELVESRKTLTPKHYTIKDAV